MDPSFDLTGRVAIVTGAARGIGLASARRLADAGARVVAADLDRPELEQACGAIGGEVEPVAVDVTAAGSGETIVAVAAERWGRIDVVFANAGYNWDAALVDMTDEQFEAMLRVHVVAPFRLLRAAAPHLRAAAKRGSVIVTSSVAGTMGNPGQVNYDAAKAAVIGLTKGLAKEWGPWGVRVNAIAPGFIETRLTATQGDAGAIEVEGREVQLGISPEHRRKGRELVALGRPGTPDEVARVVCFLASPASDYVTGQVIHVTGGLSLGMSG
jgi:3-oxoacyl-[acyl-carrier protein] reductase